MSFRFALRLEFFLAELGEVEIRRAISYNSDAVRQRREARLPPHRRRICDCMENLLAISGHVTIILHEGDESAL